MAAGMELICSGSSGTTTIDHSCAAGKVQMRFAYYEGLLAQARIKNDVDVLREMERGTMSLSGVSEGSEETVPLT